MSPKLISKTNQDSPKMHCTIWTTFYLTGALLLQVKSIFFYCTPLWHHMNSIVTSQPPSPRKHRQLLRSTSTRIYTMYIVTIGPEYCARPTPGGRAVQNTYDVDIYIWNFFGFLLFFVVTMVALSTVCHRVFTSIFDKANLGTSQCKNKKCIKRKIDRSSTFCPKWKRFLGKQ